LRELLKPEGEIDSLMEWAFFKRAKESAGLSFFGFPANGEALLLDACLQA
jgi:hypothetical protein